MRCCQTSGRAGRPACACPPRCRPQPTSRRGSSGWPRSEEHTSELQSLMCSSYAVFCLKKKIDETQGDKAYLDGSRYIVHTSGDRKRKRIKYVSETEYIMPAK